MTTTAAPSSDIPVMLPAIGGKKKKSRNKKSKGTAAAAASTSNVNRKEGVSTEVQHPGKNKRADIDTQRAIADDNESLKHPAVEVSPTSVSDTTSAGDVVASTQVVSQRDVPEEAATEAEKEEAKDSSTSNEHENGSAIAPSPTERSAEASTTTTTNDNSTDSTTTTTTNNNTVETVVEERVATTVDTSIDDDDDVTDLSNPRRRIWIVTTAALPWRTGTAVNPLMRALYLTRGRPKHYVTLVIPWLTDVASQEKVFGAGHEFTDEKSQEEWIRDFCRTRAECPEEESNLRIAFYPSAYHNSLGSIFPSVDICSLIPDEEADVAILEEPEHLNWIRIPPSKDAEIKSEFILTNNLGVEVEDGSEPQVVVEPKEDDDKKEKYGWAQKFRYVVGILHTNYAAYMGQFGFGTSVITAPALSLLSSIVVRAYCHRVIRLSAALPPLAPNKEITCNVHGVRSEFLHPHLFDSASGTIDISQKPCASVYFIGKVIWAKGFESVLEIQELYRQKTGDYFPFDIYGGGPDEKAIRRAFFGRRKRSPEKASPEIPSSPGENRVLASKVFGSTESLRGLLIQAKQAFASALEELEYRHDDSIGDDSVEEGIEVTDGQVDDEEKPRDSANPFSLLSEISEKSVSTGLAASKAVYKLANDMVKEGTNRAGDESNEKGEDEQDRDLGDQGGKSKEKANPLSVLGDLPKKSVNTGLAATKAVYKLADKLVKAGMDMTFDKETPKDGDNNGSLVFSPPKSRFEWRRTPIPARFCGIKDHVELRDIGDHKIFLNMSTTEVLCTTTAEALAMGKFVIIPDHPSNEFFLQFFNCLAYKTQEECVEKLEWALTHEPKPLSDDEMHAFSWEGATERLFKASRLTAEEQKDLLENDDRGVARLHVESMKTGHLLKKFLARES